MTTTRAAAGAAYDAPALVSGGEALPNRPTRGGASVHGWSAVGFGLGVTVVGLGIAARASGLVPWPLVSPRWLPPWVIPGAGLCFALIGVVVAVHGVLGLRRAARVRRLRALHPGEPWAWDHVWDARGARDDTMTRASHFLFYGLALLAALAPFTAVFLTAGRKAIPFAILVVLLNAFGVGLLATAGYFAARRFKYGSGVALFESFPFRRGATLELHVEAPAALPQHALATATLRCVQEREVTTDAGSNKYTTIQCFEVYRDTAPAELVAAGAGRRALRVRFAIPGDAPPTDLASDPCRYWEVDVEAATEGVDYATRFLVPVY